ncbi:zinc-finger homeodomain protein 3-like [Gastrolobium bilobum]|uniref:zinc-finger homeodomain protein 3-like n=1 Tax=Gastrolobium bilobum TaxID=150636 RepID=UPI002AB04C2B|nr:zinc-finger homeodomain protein 3-like [Gastrolobium bilobum]
MESNNFHVDKKPEKKVIRYKECLKNHAAAIGGNATDGCGEFLPVGEEGTLEALKCSACICHRNFHRKEIDSDSNCPSQHYVLSLIPDTTTQTNPILAHLFPNKSGSISPSDHSDEKDYEDGIKKDENSTEKGKKRIRTKFTQEQKEKLLCFAEKAGWRIQKLDESVVQKFCKEIGIKRRVLKVWMQNNKNTFAKRNLSTSLLG